MIAATPRFVRGTDWPDAVEAEVFAQFGQDLATDYRGTLERFLALDTLGSEHARAELRTLEQALVERGEPAPRALQEGLELLRRTDLRRALATLAKPSLVAGRATRPPGAGRRHARGRGPGAGGGGPPVMGGGHAPFLGHADEVAGQLERFVSVLG